MKYNQIKLHLMTWRVQAVVAGVGTYLAFAGDVRAGALAAHLPVMLTSRNSSVPAAPILPDGKVSFAFYGVIDQPGETRTVQAHLDENDTLYVELLIPNLAPETAIDQADLPTLAVISPTGQRQTYTPNRSEVFNEPYTDTSYISYSVGRMSAEHGTYTMEISGPVPARFVLAVGEEERPGEVVKANIGSVEDVHVWYQNPPGAGATGNGASGA